MHDGLQSTYSYSSEYKTNPVVHTHTHVAAAPVAHTAVATAVAAAPVVASAPVAALHHTVPTYGYGYRYGYYPYAHYATAANYYSPYSYVIGK